MRVRRGLVAGALVVLSFSFGGAAAAIDNVTLPFTVPRGALVEVNVTSCPVPATVTASAQLAPAGGAVQVQETAEASGGGAELVLRVPIDAALGTWTAEASCLGANGEVVDGPAIAEFTVAAFELLAFEPRAGPGGSTVTVSGRGCPTDTTESVFARIAGASDDPIPLFDPDTPGTMLELAPDGSFRGPLTVPAGAPEGENLVWAYCVSEGGEPMAGPIAGTFVVAAAVLPPTGTVLDVSTLIASAAILIGTALVLAARRHAGTAG